MRILFFLAPKSNVTFFSKSTYISETKYFDFTEINFELQSTSNDNYLKTYDLNSPIINSQNTLSSKLSFEGSNEDLDFNISTEIYEDLSKKMKVTNMK